MMTIEMADTFELETENGLRKVKFDPDAFLQRDVRILVDGRRVAEMPWPQDATPHQEVAFSVDERPLVGVSQLGREPGPVDGFGIRFDLFWNGVSLVDGGTLEAARLRALTAGYPRVFRFIDMVLRIAPAAAVPGLFIGITRRAADLGQDTTTTIVLLAILSGATLVGTIVAGWAWARIRARAKLTARRRAALGGAAILASYAVVGVAAIGMVAGLMNTGLIGYSVCDDAEAATATDISVGGQPESNPMRKVLLQDPGPNFTWVWEGEMTLEQSAASRVDTETLPQLRAAGFQSAYRRQWIRDDGTGLGADVFVFEAQEGAQSYHRAVTAYACRYSTESFAVLGGGVGLRIHYGSGDPFRDQVAWVEGNRRILIALGYRDDSRDHSEILDLVDRTRSSTPPD